MQAGSFDFKGGVPLAIRWGASISSRLRGPLKRLRDGAVRQATGRAGCGSALYAGGGSALLMASAAPGAAPGDLPLLRKRGPLDFGSKLRRMTDILLVANVAAFVLQYLSKDALTVWGAKVNSLIWQGQWWRLGTPAFLHSGLLHLLINSHALHTIGPHLELIGGPHRLLATYFVSAVAGTAASVLGTPAPSVGASGAIFGLGAALAVFYWRHRKQLGKRSSAVLRSLGITLAINMAYSVANRRIDNWGHIGGMVGGASVAFALGPKLHSTKGSGNVR